MPEHEKEERDDADAGTLLKTAIDRLDALRGTVADRLDAFSKRMDAMEMDKSKKDESEEKKDSEKEDTKADKAKKDESEEEERKDKSKKDEKEDDSTVFYHGEKAPKKDSEKEREDSMKMDKERKDKEEEEKKDKMKRKDAEEDEPMMDSAAISKRIDRVERMLPKQLTDSEREAFTDAQARADVIFHSFGKRAPAPLEAEALPSYRQRLANTLKVHSPTFKDVNVYAIGDEAAFTAIENTVYADAMRAAQEPATAEAGSLRAIKTRGDGGHTYIKYVGEPASWMNDFAGPVRLYATSINTPNSVTR